MKSICNQEKCTGCAACFNICPRDAISMEADSEGFLRPKIITDKCINCNFCINICPVNQLSEKQKTYETVFACWSKDKQIRADSSSGGVFTELATSILSEDGAVYGVALDSDNKAVHTRITSIDGLYQLRGSKYVQSIVGDSYRKVKNDLENGKVVLFTGTGCQIDGLKHFLRKEYEKLYTCDVVCHGVPSPRIYHSYLSDLEYQYKSKVKSVSFRNKDTGWFDYSMKILFENGKKYCKMKLDDPYICGFLRELYLRPSCHTCYYTGTERVSDLTIADFWGYRDSNSEDIEDNKGISLCMINNPKGEFLFEKTSQRLNVFARPLSQAVAGNRCLREAFQPSPRRREFWDEYNQSGYAGVVKNYLYPEIGTKRQRFNASRFGIYCMEVKSVLRRIKKKILK